MLTINLELCLSCQTDSDYGLRYAQSCILSMAWTLISIYVEIQYTLDVDDVPKVHSDFNESIW